MLEDGAVEIGACDAADLTHAVNSETRHNARGQQLGRCTIFQLGETMMTRLHGMAAIAIALFAPLAAAEWKGKGELGVVMARGNSQADTVTTLNIVYGF